MSAALQVSSTHQLFDEPVVRRVPDQRRRSTEPTYATLRALAERASAVELLDSGVEATAVIASVRPTGTSCHGVPVVALRLVVEMAGQPAREVDRHAIVPVDDHAAVGSRVAVLVDPARPENVLLRFDLKPVDPLS
jgi:hypothetical protein